MRTFVLSVGTALSMCIAPVAFAADPGVVAHLKTEPGSVLVLRGAELYELKEGDAVFEGDRIFTRTYGAVLFKIGGCTVGLGGQQSITVRLPDVCTIRPTSLSPEDKIAGVTIGMGAAGDTIGATPALLGLLAGGGVAAAAASQESDPASP